MRKKDGSESQVRVCSRSEFVQKTRMPDALVDRLEPLLLLNQRVPGIYLMKHVTTLAKFAQNVN